MITTHHLLMAAAALHGEDADPFRPRLGAYDHAYTRDMSDEMRIDKPGKVGTIPRVVGGCACPACDPDDEPGGDDLDGGYPARGENVYRAPVAKGQRRLTRAQRRTQSKS